MTNVDILLSGGLDSAILAAELKQKYKVNAYTFDQANCLPFATKVCEILDINLNILDIEVNNDRNEVIRAVDKLIENRNTDLYLGITALPPFKHHDAPLRASQNKIESYNKFLKAPYASLQKDEVLKKGLSLPYIDKLIKYTHSCYTTNNIRCGKCFNCVERKWAFDSIGITDKGKY